MSIEAPIKTISNGLVLHLDAANNKSYPGSGTTWTDLSGNGNNGTTSGGPTFSSANGGSIVFDGTNDSVSCGQFADNIGEMTAGVWVNTSANAGNGGFIQIIGKMLSYVDGAGWSLGIFDRSPGYICFLTQNAGGAQYHMFDVRTPTVSHVGKWTHIMATLTGGVNGTIRIYMNGVSQTLRDLSAGTVTNTSISEPVIIGKVTNYVGIAYTSGNVSMAWVYNRALSPAEILQNYDSTRSRFGL
jgi:hypothetical protein